MFVRTIARARIGVILLFTFSLLFVAAPVAPTHAASLDAEGELRIVKAAYDSLRKNLYTEPDTVALLTNAQHEAQKVLDQSAPLDSLDGSADQQWEVFAQNIRTLISQTTVTNLASGDLAHKLATNMAKTIGDLHTYFLDPTAAARVRKSDHGDTSIVNFGFTSISVNGLVYVKDVVPRSPIEEAGAKSGDRVAAIDGQSLTADNRTVLLGSPQDGQNYRLTVQHVGDPDTADLLIHMHKYTRAAVVSRVLDGHIGYIQTWAFYDSITRELDTALADLHKQNVDSLIIDFRGNAGGTSTEHVVGRFVPQGTEIGVTKGRRGQRKAIAQSDGHARETLPTDVLVDDGSGSASEIATLAFHEFTTMTIIGSKTAGAIGTTQRFDLPDGSLLSITVSVYTSAKGETLNGVGFTPDIVVPRSNDDVIAGRDPQLTAAITDANAKVTPVYITPYEVAA